MANQGEIADDVADAVHRLFADVIEPSIECRPDASKVFRPSNEFRSAHCYTEAVDTVLRSYEPSLRLLHFRWACRLETGHSSGAGHGASEWQLARGEQPSLGIGGWKGLCRAFGLIHADLTERDVALAFAMSRMRVIDEQSDRGRAALEGLTFEDFLEALCRLATQKALPTDRELHAAGAVSAGEHLWHMRTEKPDEFDHFVESRARPWGSEPPQSVARCVAHLCSLLVVTCQLNEGDGIQLSESQVDAFIFMQNT